MLIMLAIPKPDDGYFIGGTFTGEFFSKNKKIKSESSDLFITLLDSDLSPVLANHYGGPKIK